MTDVYVAGPLWAMRERELVDAMVDRLFVEFGDRFSRRWVTWIVRGCVRDLAGIPRGALAELGERSARQRLLEIAVDQRSAG
ncbi:hypothetical protein ACFVUS_00945 [Nocardia sp. NPDC058058]|uniref:hypothetical protein n=1 Tax=Nocardia sp. NPDC058058 TaxID=3346317 RepID=UPI0036DE27A5